MPNPFMRHPLTTSKTDVDRPVYVEPIPESVRGHVFAYRGMETHGVDPNNDANNPEDYGYLERGVTVEYEPEELGPDPIPVRIVTGDTGHELKRYRTARTTSGVLGDRPATVLGRDPFRRKVTVKNTSADIVYLGHETSAAGPMDGYPLSQNETIAIDSTREIYAQSSTANACVLALMIEYVVVDAD